MKLEFEKSQEIDLSKVGYGDVLIMADGSKWLIIADTDGGDYRAVNLDTFRPTGFEESIQDLVILVFDNSTVARIIKSEDLVLGVR